MSTFQKFIQYYKPYKKVFIFDLICAAFISLVDLAYPQILRSLTKTLFLKDASMILKTLPIIGGILFICYIFQAFCKYYVSCQGHIMGAQMERDMRRKLFDHYENLSFSYYDQHNTGQMMSRLVSDLFDISEAAHHGPENLFISLVKIVGSFIFLFIIQWKLAIILLAIVLLMIFFSAKQNRKMQATFLDNRRKIGDVNASLQDSLAGIRIVQSFANEDIEREKFRVGNEAFLDSKRDNYRAMGSFQSGNTFFQGMMYLVTLLAGGYFIALGQMSAADLAMYALYIGIFISPIQILVELTEMIQKGMSGFIRYQSVYVKITMLENELKNTFFTFGKNGPVKNGNDITFNIETRTFQPDEVWEANGLTYIAVGPEHQYNVSGPLGLINNFHAVGFTKVHNSVHTNGNVLTKELTYGSNFGTKQVSNEISYIESFTSITENGMQCGADDNDILVIGKDIKVTCDGQHFYLNGQKLDKPKTVYQDTQDYKFLDVSSLKTEAVQLITGMAGQPDQGVTKSEGKLIISEGYSGTAVCNITLEELQSHSQIEGL